MACGHAVRALAGCHAGGTRVPKTRKSLPLALARKPGPLLRSYLPFCPQLSRGRFPSKKSLPVGRGFSGGGSLKNAGSCATADGAEPPTTYHSLGLITSPVARSRWRLPPKPSPRLGGSGAAAGRLAPPLAAPGHVESCVYPCFTYTKKCIIIYDVLHCFYCHYLCDYIKLMVILNHDFGDKKNGSG